MTDPTRTDQPSAGASRPLPPGPVRDLAHARRSARLARDWAAADRLKAEIEAAGWRVVDRGVDFALLPATPPDRLVDGLLVHGSAASVPSRLEEPSSTARTILIVLPTGGDPNPSAVTLEPPADTSMVVAMAGAGACPVSGAEVVRLPAEAPAGALLSAGLRRLGGTVAIVAFGLDAGRRACQEPVAIALEGPLSDPGVAVSGSAGARTEDLRELVPVEAGEADVLLGELLAFRRADVAPRLPPDERLVAVDRVAEWWTLRLREAEDPYTLAPPRGAEVVAVKGSSSAAHLAGMEAEPGSRRDFYRLHDRFAGAEALLSGSGPRR